MTDMTISTEVPEIDADLVASQNDRFRKACCLGLRDDTAVPGKLVYTAALSAREPAFIAAILKAIG